MKEFTNHTPGARGINLVDGTTRWIEPGETVELDPKSIVGDVPDLGKKGAAPVDDADVKALKARVSDLEKENAELTKQVEELTKPADPLDHDGNGKKGGAAPAKD